MGTQTKLFRALLFGSVYFVEGAILTFVSGFNAVYLRSFNVSYTQIGIAGGIALLPFILKIFIGMLSDRVNLLGRGHRRPYMVIGLLMQAAGALLMPFVNPAAAFPLYVALLLFISLGMSTYDTCSDGLAIDVTPDKERGSVQGVMVAGRALGAIVLATAIGVLVERVSWAAAFVFVGLVTLLPLVLVLQVREGARGAEREFSLSGFRSFLTPVMGLFLLLGILYPLVLYSANGMLGAFLNEAVGASMSQVGLFTSLFGVGAVLGGLAGGPLTDRLGRRASLLAALLVTTLASWPWPAAAWPWWPWGRCCSSALPLATMRRCTWPPAWISPTRASPPLCSPSSWPRATSASAWARRWRACWSTAPALAACSSPSPWSTWPACRWCS
ncbi:MAG TPA: MFS transporter [Anaerolineae bacterium]|nr:MFS transporter [Anaerolineae bacterium]HOR00148.1 MFS transporter [Anaerolineae bacterium]HPL28609.1 MFS transporter [Anaerolineae bacterium]